MGSGVPDQGALGRWEGEANRFACDDLRDAFQGSPSAGWLAELNLCGD
jgi:hypothetical protein